MKRVTAALLVFAALAALAAAGSGATTGWASGVRIFGSLTPEETPGPGRVPSTLRVGFTSKPVEGAVPGVEEISLDVIKWVSFARWWPQRCSLGKLYADSGEPRRECATARVGHGNVTSEITIPGQAPVTVSGHLTAYAAYAQGSQKILAQVNTGQPLPLVYVIPFDVERRDDEVSLIVSPRSLHRMLGKCARSHPHCFGPDPYTLKGIYSHISRLEIAFHRILHRRGGRISFVSGGCVTPNGYEGEDDPQFFNFIRIGLSFSSGNDLAETFGRSC